MTRLYRVCVGTLLFLIADAVVRHPETPDRQAVRNLGEARQSSGGLFAALDTAAESMP